MYKEWEERVETIGIQPIRDMTLVSAVSLTIIFIRHIVRKKFGRLLMKILNQSKDEKEKCRKKFEGSLYRFVYYAYSLSFEIFALRNQSWIFSPVQYTFNWPNNNVPLVFRLHHLVQLCYYLTSTCFLFVEPKLKDFYQMLIHHIITITLISSGYYYNLVRYGIMVMIIHDSADPFLEFAKLNVYSKNMLIANIIFVIFAVIFMVQRLLIFPGIIIIPSMYFSFCYGRMVLTVLSSILAMLFCVNLVWAYYILKMAADLVKKKQVSGDIRETSKNE
ncbi:hypothetical protein VCUG_01299 [Vavraia culicis subsp. floridensis]|uniref:TLC domain-containing protein n=1 Tax=Vavraia culicis (isolate floridensis) TaxID=948595 RepID=L2GU85_VAVCU|nr:uncharacterized protein VCUG_01299 [Vavraia culicis subsp. floridensis]ELA47199.1 hypothetical protein VCUG_01299 [Vavraia culicis subsp. floridensis]